jgi:hypothetical protein
MRDVTASGPEKATEAAIAEACVRLRLLAEPARSRSIISWHDPDAVNDPRDIYEAAIEYVIALLDPASDSRAADEFLGADAPIVRKAVLPALRLGRLPKHKGPHGNLLRDRWIAAVVTTICQRHGLNPYRNPYRSSTATPASEHSNGCAVVAEALDRLGIRLAERSVERIYMKHGQA